MANRYYRPGEERASRVEALFNTIAHRYDLINDLQSLGLHRRWKQQVITAADITPGDVVMDVCCGTGDIAFALQRTGARVLALDFSAPMLQAAIRRQAQGGSPVAVKSAPPQFIRADALRLPTRDAQVSAVTIGYGLRNLADIPHALQEFHRVTRPGGKLVVLDFGKPSSFAWRSLYFAYLRLVVPLFGRVFCGDAATYRYILESLEQYPAQAGLGALMERAGWTKTRTTNILGGIMSLSIGHKSSRSLHPAKSSA